MRLFSALRKKNLIPPSKIILTLLLGLSMVACGVVGSDSVKPLEPAASSTTYSPLAIGTTIGSADADGSYFLFGNPGHDASGNSWMYFLSHTYGSQTYKTKRLRIENSDDPYALTSQQLQELGGCFWTLYYGTATSPQLISPNDGKAVCATPSGSSYDITFVDSSTSDYTHLALVQNEGTVYENVMLGGFYMADTNTPSVESSMAFNSSDQTLANLKCWKFPKTSTSYYSVLNFANALNSGTFTTGPAAQSAFQSLSMPERLSFLYVPSVVFTGDASKAIVTTYSTAKTAYETLFTDTTGIYKAATPTPTIDYETDRIVGLRSSEIYTISGTFSEGTFVYTSLTPFQYSDGTVGLNFYTGTKNTSSTYSLYGSTFTFGTYNSTATYASDTVSLSVVSRKVLTGGAATASAAKASLTADMSVDALYHDELDLSVSSTGYTSLEYALVPASTTLDASYLSGDFFTWQNSGTFKNTSLNFLPSLAVTTAYQLYIRDAPTSSSGSVSAAGTAPMALTSFTTLAATAGKTLHAEVESYKEFQDNVALTSATGDLLAGLQSVADELYSRLTGTASAIYGPTYFDNSYALIAQAYSNEIELQSLLVSVPALALNSDSARTSAAIALVVSTLKSTDIYASTTTAATLKANQTDLELILKEYRYGETNARSLVNWVNSTIVPPMASLSDMYRTSLWSVITAEVDYVNKISTDPTYATYVTNSDAALATAKTAITSALNNYLGGN
jgi:hypothetical protein